MTILSLLIGSVGLNFILIGAGIIFILKKGGWKYLVQKLTAKLSRKPQLASMESNSYYCYKVDYFSGLIVDTPDIVLLGDSLTDYWQLSEAFPQHQILNRGIAGDRTDGVLNRIRQIIALKPHKLFIEIGINDLIQGRSVTQTLANYQLILDQLQAQLPETKIVIQSLLPVNNDLFKLKQNRSLDNQKIIEFNQQLCKLTAQFSHVYLDLWSHFIDSTQELDRKYTFDGVHLTSEGYQQWQKLLAPYL